MDYVAELLRRQQALLTALLAPGPAAETEDPEEPRTAERPAGVPAPAQTTAPAGISAAGASPSGALPAGTMLPGAEAPETPEGPPDPAPFRAALPETETAAEAAGSWALPGPLAADTLSLSFERDARRYDGGFSLYE